jgi:serine/threonine protein kinase/Flp pilus assembly protein TadD
MANTCPKCDTKNPDTVKFCGECGTQLPPTEDIEVTETMEIPKEELTTGSTFAGRYQIIEELGKGGMGKVYKVHDTKIREKIALKLIKPEIAKDKKTLERFSNELKFARKIRHKNICQMFDLGEDKGTHFITMEFVEGQDLKKLIRQSGQLAIGTTINIAKQVCDGLVEAHSSGIVHRDLKPSNIMIDVDGNARIMDFGIARSIEGKGITGAGVMIGTPEYMSPEQVEGKEVDQRSDIYSLGVILYEMATGRVPFEGDTPFTVGVKHKSEFPQNPKEINSQIPDNLNNVILKCLEKNKEKRYQNSGDVRSELENIEKGIPTTEIIAPEKKPLTSREITVRFSLKKFLIPTLAIIAIFLIGLIIWSPWAPDRSAAIPTEGLSLAIVYFENNTGDENMDNWRKALAELIIDDLSQSNLLKILSVDRLYSILKRHDLLETINFSSEDLKKVAEQAGSKNILWGNFQRAGDTIRINSRIMNVASGELLGTQSTDSLGEEGLFEAVDDLTIQIKKALKFTNQEIANDRDEEIGNITTTSPEAYKYYIEGRSLLRERLNNEKVVNYMERAISIDPDFAMAYRSLANMYMDFGDLTKAKQYIKKAFELKDKLTEVENYLITADYLRLHENYDEAIKAYKYVLKIQPDNWVANNNLAVIYNIYEDHEKAIELYEANRNYGDDHIQTYFRLADKYAALEEYQKSIEALDDYLKKFSDNVRIHEWLSLIYAVTGEYDHSLIEVDRALSLDQMASIAKGPIYHLQGEFEAAEDDYKSWLDKKEIGWKMNGRRYLGILYRTLGQYGKAKKEAQLGLEFAVDIDHRNWKRIFYDILAIEDLMTGNLGGAYNWAEKLWDSAVEDEIPGWQAEALWLKLKVKLGQNNIKEAIMLAEEVKKIVDSTPNTKDISWYLSNMGLIEVKRENYAEAVELFSQSYSLIGGQRSWRSAHGVILFNLAEAYYLNGDIEAAKKEYENIMALTTGRLFWGDLYVKSYYNLGKIHEEQGNAAKAIEHYEKFLDLWKDADTGIAELEDARKRLAALKNQ